MEPRFRKIVLSILEGIITGLIYYLILVYIFPTIIYSSLHMPPEMDVNKLMMFLAFMLAMSTIAYILKPHPVSIPFSAMTKIIAVVAFIYILNFGKLHAEFVVDKTRIEAEINIAPLLFIVAAFTLIGIIFDFVPYIEARRRETI